MARVMHTPAGRPGPGRCPTAVPRRGSAWTLTRSCSGADMLLTWLAKASDGTEGGWVSTRVACTATKEYESSCTFEPCLTCSNALRRVQNPGSSLVTPAGSSGRSSRPACRWRRPGDPAPPTRAAPASRGSAPGRPPCAA